MATRTPGPRRRAPWLRAAPLAAAAGALWGACLTAPTLGPGVYCDDATPCTADPGYPLCDPFTHQCVQKSVGPFASCTGDGDCADPALPMCDPAHHTCVACRAPDDDARCQARDPAHPRCDPDRGRCVACLPATQDLDCAARSATTPVCGLSGCRGCRAHSECASGVCASDGSCAPASDIAYVDNEDGRCSGARSGTRASPYCEIGDALLDLGARHRVRVAGRATPYKPLVSNVAWPVPPAMVIGDGRGASPSSRISALDQPCLHLDSLQFGWVRGLTLDGMELSGCTQGVLGVNSGVITLVRTTVSGSTAGAAIEVRACTGLALDGAVVQGNGSGGGVALYATPATITNSFLGGNRGRFGGVYVDPFSLLDFSFNTVRDNVGSEHAGGIYCDPALPAAPRIEASIFAGNNPTHTGDQLGDACGTTFPDVAVDLSDPGGPVGVVREQLAWVGSDYHLLPLPHNPNVIDALRGGHVAYPSHDIDGNVRPQGKGYDLGAQEVE